MTRFDRAPNDFLLAFHSNHGPISHRFRDTIKYWLKIANFAPVGVTLHIGISKSSLLWENQNDWGLYQAIKKFDGKFSRFDTIHQQTDGHRTTAKTALCIASRGNKMHF